MPFDPSTPNLYEIGKKFKEEVLANATLEQRLKGVDPEEIFKRFKPEERLRGLKPEEIEAYLKKLKGKKMKKGKKNEGARK